MTSFLEYKKNKELSVRITEELTQKEEQDAQSMMENGHSHYRRDFLRHNPKAQEAFQNNPDKKKWSIRVPVSLTETSAAPHAGVTSFLRSHRYDVTPENYKLGIANKTTMVGDPEKGIQLKAKTVSHKIGGLLEKHNASDELKKNYTNDTFRNGAKTKDYDAVLTGDSGDVYAGSTGQGWVSCANKRKGVEKFDGKGPAALMMKGEINNHTHHVYLVPRGGNVDTDAVGRMSFKHHTGVTTGHQTLLPEDHVYGTPPTAFAHAAKKVVSDLFDRKSGEIYKKNTKVYNDNAQHFDFPEGDLKSEHLDAAWKTIGRSDDGAKNQLYQKIDPTQKYKSIELNNVSKHIRGIGEAAHSGDFTKVANRVEHADRDIARGGHYHLVGKNPHMDAVLDTGAKTFDINKPEHVKQLLSLTEHRNHIKRTFAGRVSRTIQHAKTPDEYHAISELKDSGLNIGPDTYKVPIDNGHTLGKNPHDTIVKSLSNSGALTRKSYDQSFLSTAPHQKHNGNVYDTAIEHENSGVPGMSTTIDDMAEEMSKRNIPSGRRNYTHADNQALSYHLMKPNTRSRISSVLGEDHTKIMRNNRAAIDDHKEHIKRISDAKQKIELEGN